MFEDFEDNSVWTDNADATSTADNANMLQGSECLDVSKDGTATTTAICTHKLTAPWDVRPWRTDGSRNVVWRCYHANFTGVASAELRLVYRFDTSGNASIFDSYRLSSFSGGAWNTCTVPVDTPTASTGNPTDAHRCHVIAHQVVITTSLAATTISNVLFDAAEIDGTKPPAAGLIFDNQTLLVPGFTTWNRLRDEQFIPNVAEQGAEILLMTAKEGIRFGISQVRRTDGVDATNYLRAVEDYLRIFGQYTASNTGWGVAWPSKERVNTTLSSAASKGDTSLALTSVVDVNFLGDDCAIRVGPSDSRDVDRVRIISESGGTVYLDRPLAHAHESGVSVRSLHYYPSLIRTSQGHPVKETGSAVTFEVEALETA